MNIGVVITGQIIPTCGSVVIPPGGRGDVHDSTTPPVHPTPQRRWWIVIEHFRTFNPTVGSVYLVEYWWSYYWSDEPVPD